MTLKEKEFQMLKVLLNSKCKLRKAIIENANPELIHAIIECIDNYLHNKIPTTIEEINRLGKYKKIFRSIINKGSLKIKKTNNSKIRCTKRRILGNTHTVSHKRHNLIDRNRNFKQ